MRSLLVLFTLICMLPSLSAQQFKRIYLFDDFVQAKVMFRNHTSSYVMLNYDASNKTMLFKNGEELMEMTNPEQVDSIRFGNRTFVPASKGFREVAHLKNGTVQIDWLLKEINTGSKGALGTTTQGTVQNVEMLDFGLSTEKHTDYQRQKLGSTDVYKRKSDNTYYIPVNGKMEKVKNLKQLCKLFPNQKEQIEAYAKECKTDMKQTYDALVLLDYVLGLAVQ